MKKIVTIIGARPQFIKASALSRAILQSGAGIEERIVHTGQHFDHEMSRIFFEELQIPEPDCNLHVAGLSHGAMTARMLTRLEDLLLADRPDMVVVYGDTNSTLAGALAAVKLEIPVAHVEAGLRSFNRAMPEEVNRVVADRLSQWLFCPSQVAVDNLANEGIRDGVSLVGDVMFDALLHFKERARQTHDLGRWGVTEGDYLLCTVHRAENTDDPQRLAQLFSALGELAGELPLLLPLHPRTRKRLDEFGLMALTAPLALLPPLSYLEMLRLQMSARAILTDSGGVQKEAFFLGVPCLTLRDETEWVETVAAGGNRLCGPSRAGILAAWRQLPQGPWANGVYGDGHAAEKIIKLIMV